MLFILAILFAGVAVTVAVTSPSSWWLALIFGAVAAMLFTLAIDARANRDRLVSQVRR